MLRHLAVMICGLPFDSCNDLLIPRSYTVIDDGWMRLELLGHGPRAYLRLSLTS